MVTDETDAVNLTLCPSDYWHLLVLQAMKVNYWNRKYLNSNKSTKIDTCDDVALYHKSTSVVDIQNS